ncbi:MBL fold metallo-hydrolase [Butyrivibrio sp. VCD2006]|uniref:MBL fold metallo-hydrolase n=1 Tax=Butyrivibrio sp. VCD2006 TaxID=1280664 RepID=UPI0004162F75|nr:MBL fold metallo-hydrolase [Butyrivibrio sp. VCD2006]
MLDSIRVFTHSSIRIESRFGVIYADPFGLKESFNDAAFILITHDHYDHFSPEDIAKVIKSDTIIVGPEKMEDKLRSVAGENNKVYALAPGVYKEINGLEIETVPAYNNLKPFHPKVMGWVGYIIRLDKRVYIAGDTSLTKDNQQVKCEVAMVPIGGKFTMNPEKAAELINIIRPEYAIPTHYGKIAGNPECAVAFKENVKPPVKVVEKIEYFD